MWSSAYQIVGSLTLLGAVALLAPNIERVTEPSTTDVVDRAMDRMGGADLLSSIERARFESVTLWHRQTFQDRPFSDVVGSYEMLVDQRDYAANAWRNTRRFVGSPGFQEITDLVSDSVAIRLAPKAPGGPSQWAPLNVAYVDERDELFAFAPERLLLAARSARDLKALPDTVIGGLRHARVAATIGRFPTTIFIRRTDNFLAFARYRAAQPNDFGLAGFGNMEVEVWYQRWAPLPVSGNSRITYPLQWDIERSGVPYKRLTLTRAQFNPPAQPDSFAVGDSLRAAFMATSTKPMWDISMDSAKIMEGRFAQFGVPGFATSAVKIGGKWVLLETGQVPRRVEQEVAWLNREEPGSQLGGAVVTTAGAPRGGIAWVTNHNVPLFVGPGAWTATQTILQNWSESPRKAVEVKKGRWVQIGADSLWLEPFDIPDSPGALAVWSPSLKWAYSAMAASPVGLEMLNELIRSRGWSVDRIGSLRGALAHTPDKSGG